MSDFDKRWDCPSLEDPSEVFKKFHLSINQAFSVIEEHMTSESIESYTYAFGLTRTYNRHYSQYTRETTVIESLRYSQTPEDLYKKIEVIFSLRFKGGHRDSYLKKLNEILTLQPVEVDIVSDSRLGIILLRKGERYLDKEVVNKVLSFLDDKSLAHFVEALHDFQKGTNASRIRSCEQLRRTIEEYLRYKLSNNANLKKNISELLKDLETSTNKEIRNLIQKELDYMDNFFNGNSKHEDGTISEQENEFLIYQVGSLLRYVEYAIK